MTKNGNVSGHYETEEVVDSRTPLLRDVGRSSSSASTLVDQNECPSASDVRPANMAWILLFLYFGVLLLGLDTTIAATLITPISSSFHRLNDGAWIHTAYLLTASTLTPVFAKVSDIVGRRPVVCFCAILFALGSLLAGVANSMEMLIIARLLQGAGGGGTGIMATIVISDLVSIKQRGIFGGFGAISWNIGASVGGPLGGFLHEAIGWRFAFLVQVPMLVSIAIASYFLIDYRLPSQTNDRTEIFKKVDYLGSLTLIASIGALVLGVGMLTDDGYELTHPLIVSIFLLSVLSTILFIYVELFVAAYPILPLHLLTERSCASAALATFFGAAGTIPCNLHFPMLLQIVLNLSPGEAGARLLPNTFAGGVGGIVGGLILRSTGKYYYLIIISVLTVLPAWIMLAQLDETSPMIETWTDLFPIGLGISSFYTTSFVGVLNVVKQEDMAVVTGIIVMAKNLGCTLGLAFASGIQQSVLLKQLKENITGPGASEIIERVRENAESIVKLPETLRKAAIGSYTVSLHTTFISNAILVLICAGFCLFIQEKPLSDKAKENKEGVSEV